MRGGCSLVGLWLVYLGGGDIDLVCVDFFVISRHTLYQ